MRFILRLAPCFVATARAVLLSALACVRNDSPISFRMAWRWLNHPNFSLWARLRLLQEALLCLSSSTYHTFCLSGSEYRCGACPEPVPLLLAGPLVIREKIWVNMHVVEHSDPPDSV